MTCYDVQKLGLYTIQLSKQTYLYDQSKQKVTMCINDSSFVNKVIFY